MRRHAALLAAVLPTAALAAYIAFIEYGMRRASNGGRGDRPIVMTPSPLLDRARLPWTR